MAEHSHHLGVDQISSRLAVIGIICENLFADEQERPRFDRSAADSQDLNAVFVSPIMQDFNQHVNVSSPGRSVEEASTRCADPSLHQISGRECLNNIIAVVNETAGIRESCQDVA